MRLVVGTMLLMGSMLVAHPSAQQTAVVPDQVSCSGCTIEVDTAVRLQSDDPAYAIPREPYDVEVDDQGRFWVVLMDSPVLVFGPDGRFLRTVGRIGEGPGEFATPYRIVSAPDSMVVIDSRGLCTVFGLDFEYIRNSRFSTRLYEAAVIQWPDAVLFNSRVNTPESVGFPLHIVDVSTNVAGLVKSLGLDPQGELRPGQPPQLQRRLWRGRDGVWVADRLTYRVAQLGSHGELLAVLERHPSWFPEGTQGLVGLPDTPPEPSVTAVSGDDAGRVWVFTRTPRDGWEQRWAETAEKYGAIPEGARSVRPEQIPPRWQLWKTLIEIIDPEAGRVVVRENLDDFVTDTLADGRVVTYTETESDYTPVLRALSLRVAER